MNEVRPPRPPAGPGTALRRRVTAFFLVAVLVGLGVLQAAIERETVSPLRVVNPDGQAGTALVLHHPGLSDLQEQLTTAFSGALIEADWRVERTTTSASAPVELEGYDLLVLGTHTYWWAPDGPTRRYLERADGLDGIPTVALVSALGGADRAVRVTEERVRAAGGRPERVQPFFVLRPNDEADPRPNREVALEQAALAGAAAAQR